MFCDAKSNWVLFLAIFILHPLVVLSAGKTISQKSEFGRCSSQRIAKRGVILCSQAEVAAHSVASLDKGAHYETLHADAYTSIHLGREHSFHFSTYINAVFLPAMQKVGGVDLLAYQWGKLGYDPWVFSAGKQWMPFGIRWLEMQNVLRHWQDDSFYFGPSRNVKASYTTARFGYELAFGEDHSQLSPLPASERIDIATFRTSYDMTSEYGTRWVFSLAGKDDGLRSYGLGLIFRADKRASTQLEWIRRQGSQDLFNKDFDQIFRLLITGPKQSQGQAAFNFDLSRNQYRLFTFMYTHEIYSALLADIALAFRRMDAEGRLNVYLVMGFRGHV